MGRLRNPFYRSLLIVDPYKRSASLSSGGVLSKESNHPKVLVRGGRALTHKEFRVCVLVRVLGRGVEEHVLREVRQAGEGWRVAQRAHPHLCREAPFSLLQNLA